LPQGQQIANVDVSSNSASSASRREPSLALALSSAIRSASCREIQGKNALSECARQSVPSQVEHPSQNFRVGSSRESAKTMFLSV